MARRRKKRRHASSRVPSQSSTGTAHRGERAVTMVRGPHGGRRRLALAGAVAGLVLLLLIGWYALPVQPVQRESGLDVLLVTIDTLRADALGTYGNPAGTSPWIDRLAAGGVRFERTHAHNVLTLPSHANILAGRYPFDHGVRDNAGFRLAEDVETLATLLEARGYRTGAFVSGAPLHSRFGLARGFATYDDSFVDRSAPEAFVVAERPAAETVSLAREWLAADDPRPRFLWLHVYDPHAPFRPPEPFASRFEEQPYLGEVAATDEALRPLLEPLIEAGAEGRTLVVLTSDHGESLGEHGELTHGLFAYEATLRVPLVLFAPRLFRPRVVSTPARHVDLLPTVLDALELPIPADVPGRSLLPEAVGRAPSERPATYFEALSGQLVRGWAPLYGVLDEGWKYVDLPVPELYDLAKDPGETSNVVAAQARTAERLSRILEEFRIHEAPVTRVREDSVTLERLAALGYLGGAGSVDAEYTAADDPKNLVELDGMLQRVLTLHRDGSLEAALELCRELIRRRPGMAVSHAQLATIYTDLGRHDDAIGAARRAVELNPTDVMPVLLLGRNLTEAGQAREAAELLEPYAARDEPDVGLLVAFAEALTRAARPEAALASFRRARELDPDDAMILVKMAMTELVSGEADAARATLEQALGLEPDIPLAHHQLGLIALHQGDEAAAERRFRRALELGEHEVDTLLNLGMLLARQGRRSEARPFLERFVHIAPTPLFGREVERVRTWLALAPGSAPSGSAPPDS